VTFKVVQIKVIHF